MADLLLLNRFPINSRIRVTDDSVGTVKYVGEVSYDEYCIIYFVPH